MHPSLRPQNFSSLPLLLRKVANSAASGSVRDLRILCARIPGIPRSQAEILLPAFYANLDPAAIPQQLAGNEQIPEAVSRAIQSIDGLYSGLPITSAAAPDLWVRFWPWIEFLGQYLGSYSVPRQLHDDRFYINFVIFVACFQEDDRMRRLMGATPGVRAILAKAWRAIIGLGDEDRNLRTNALIGLFPFLLGSLDASNAAGFTEFVDGAGGSISHLGSLIISFFDNLVSTPRTVLSRQEVDYVHAAFTFIKNTNNISGREDIGAHALCAAMRPQGFVRATTTIICALSTSTVTGVESVLQSLITFLGINIHTPRMALWIGQAFKYGLLRAMLLSGDRNPGAAYHSLWTSLLSETITPALIYHAVVARVEAALADVGDLARTSRFAKRPEWRDFIALAEERLPILKSLDAVKWVSFRACDNLQCGKIRNRGSCSRCAACRSAYYCSSDCQIVDWREGGHRGICTPDLRFSLNEFQELSWHDRVFMRAVLHYDYIEKTADIAAQRTVCLSMFPNDPIYVLFTYMWGRAVVAVESARHVRVTQELKGLEWERHVLMAQDTVIFWFLSARVESNWIVAGYLISMRRQLQVSQHP
ncbi:hypothetical protein DFH09DRAFT_1427884 [Mycena vulgaris]|nr:hypothetical protein DFH09DRAFT_1427884 [Mycena vulgaris]